MAQCTAFGHDERRAVGNLTYTWSPESCPPGPSAPFTLACLDHNSSTVTDVSGACAVACYRSEGCLRAQYGAQDAPNTRCAVGETACVIFKVWGDGVNATRPSYSYAGTNASCISDLVGAP